MSLPFSVLDDEFIDLLPAAVYVCEAPSGIIVRYNRLAVELWGREPACGDSAERFCGAFRLFHPDGTVMAHAQTPMAQVLRDGQVVRNQKLIIERPDRSRVTVLANIVPIRNDQGVLIGTINLFQDFTERKQAEETLRIRARQQAAVAGLGQRALTGIDLASLLDEAVSVVARTLDVEYVKVLELLPDRSALLLRAGVGWKAEQVGRATVGTGRGSQAGYTLLTREPIIVEDWQTETRFARPSVHDGHELASGMTVIIGGRECPFGVLGAHSARRRTFTEDDIHFLQAIANVLAAAIERKRAEEEMTALKDELAAQLADMTRLHELSRRLATNLELKPVLNEVLAAVTALQGTDMGLVTLYDRELGDLCPVASTGFADEYLARIGRLPLGVGSCGKAVVERRGIIVEDVETDPIFAPYREAARSAGYRAVYSTPLFTRSGEVLGTIATYFRESHRPSDRQARLVELYARQAAEFIEHARLYREAREAVRARDVFLARASHELRTPLTSILASIRLLQHASPLTGAARELVEMASRNAKAMRVLLNDLLDASKLAAGETPLAIELVSLADVVLASREVVEVQAREKGISLHSVVPAGLMLRVDPLKLIQVLTNLLANAVRHTHSGGEIVIEAEADGSYVVIRVRDTGEGIVPEHREAIFEPFFQARKPGATGPRGTGLGLAICRQIVTLHGGEIWAESAGPGLGSTFTVRLPHTTGTECAA